MEIYDYCFLACMILLVVIACIITAMLTAWNLRNSWKGDDITDDDKESFINEWATEFIIPKKGRK